MKALLCALPLILAAGATPADEAAGMPTATDTLLLEQPLHGMDGKIVHAVRLEVPPGWQTPRHTHPANVVVYVLEGAIEVEIEGGGTHTAKAGEIIYETPERPMIGRNASSEEGARLLVFHVGEEGAPLTVPAE